MRGRYETGKYDEGEKYECDKKCCRGLMKRRNVEVDGYCENELGRNVKKEEKQVGRISERVKQKKLSLEDEVI